MQIRMNNCRLPLLRIFLIAVVSLVVTFDTKGQTNVVPDSVELRVLRNIYDSLGGSGWTNKTNWPTLENWPATATSAQFDTWYGIVVSSGDIRTINFTGNNLTGQLPLTLSKLSRLAFLYMNGNDIAGPIPPSIGMMNYLEHFYLHDNNLTGAIPSELGGMDNLDRLYLNGNGLSGSIPSGLCDLPDVTDLRLSGNNLTGSIPSNIGDLEDLVTLYLDFNELSGTIPTSITDLVSLRNLNLSSNQLTGSIPENIGDLVDMVNLHLNTNQLTGTLPSSIGNMADLEILSLAVNELSGEIPATFSALGNLWYLSLRQNDLGGEFPDLNDWPQITQVFIYDNHFSGDFPSGLQNCTALTTINAHKNNFTSLPATLLGLQTITSLNFEYNDIDSIPDFSTQVNKANLSLYLRDNRLDFSQIETFVNQGLDLTTYSLQKLFDNVRYIKAASGEDMIITPRDAGVNGLYTWYFQADGTTGYVIVNSQNQDVTQKTFKRVAIGSGGAGLYKYRMTNSTLSGIIESVPIAVRVGEDVIWNQMEGVALTSAGNITKTAADGWNNAKTISENSLATNTDGWFEFVIDATVASNNYAIGFSQNTTNTRASVAYGVGISNVGGQKLYIHESIESGSELGTWALGDVIRVRRQGSTMRYYKNGYQIRSVSVSANNQYAVKTLIHDGTAPVFTSSFLLDPSRGTVPDALEYQALRDLYESLAGAAWTIKTNWPESAEGIIDITAAQMADWYGVDETNGDIDRLILLNNNLAGQIPESISTLSALSTIDFRINNINGPLPSSITSLTNLVSLQIYDNEISGPIPEDIGDLDQLLILDISNNNFFGPIPASIGQLVNLTRLHVNSNGGLNGSLPESFYDLTDLTFLGVYGTDIGGQLSNSIGNLTQLEEFWGQSNEWSGPLPANLSTISTLEKLYLFDNNFSGSIPTSYGGFSSLTHLHLHSNELDGTLPAELGNLAVVEEMVLYNNDFTGNLPDNFRSLPAIKNISLWGNQLSGAIPEWLGELNTLTSLSLSNNQFTGTIPGSLGNLSNLTSLFLGGQNISGTIPDALNDVDNLFYLDLGFSGLEGRIPDWLAAKASLKIINMGGAKFTSLPDFSSRTDKHEISLTVYNNQIALGDIEKNLTGPNTHAFQNFQYTGQQCAPVEPVYTALDGELKIESAQGGPHSVFTWEKQVGGVWTNVDSQNQSADATDFIIHPADGTHSGLYRYTITNSWVSATPIQSESVEITLTDPVNDSPLQRGYNGMIASVRWKTEQPHGVSEGPFTGMYLYSYDEKYQIRDATWAGDFSLTGYSISGNNQYRLTGMNYDPNGNILNLKRYSGSGAPVNDFTYQYNSVPSAPKNNRLESVSGHSTYQYNARGQMTIDDKWAVGADDQYVEYDVTGKVTKVFSEAAKAPGDLKVEFIYDDRGFRLAKVNHETIRTTWYIRDASGNVISIYEQEGIPNNSEGMPVLNEEPLDQTEVPIYGSGKLGIFYPGQDGSTAYEVTDHLGNVRALVRDNVNSYTATMEDNDVEDISNPRVEEMLYFNNLSETEDENIAMNHTPAGRVEIPERAAYLYWIDGTPGMEASDKGIGPSIALQVQAGDKIEIETWAKFERQETFARNFLLTALSSMLGNNFAGLGGFEGIASGQVTSNIEQGLTLAGYPEDNTEVEVPFAYLNYILYDDNLTVINAGWLRVSDDAGFDAEESGLHGGHEHLKFDPVSIAENGYIYVWVSNQSEETKVWFDDLTVSVSQTLVTQATDYGVWGDVIREQKTDDRIYRFGYQGQFAEKDEETSWNHFELREYDPIVGRWAAVDPYGQYWSPYVNVGNDPINYVDPSGGSGGPARQDPRPSSNLELAVLAANGTTFFDPVEILSRNYEWYQYFNDHNPGGDFLYEVNKFNPIAQVANSLSAYATGQDFYGVAMSNADATVNLATVIPIFKLGKVVNVLGSTGRVAAQNLAEELAMQEIISNPSAGKILIETMEDASGRWHGWSKMTNKTAHGVEIHYNALWENGVIKAVDDFKFK